MSRERGSNKGALRHLPIEGHDLQYEFAPVTAVVGRGIESAGR